MPGAGRATSGPRPWPDRLYGVQVVGGSNPLAPTNQIKGFREGGLFISAIEIKWPQPKAVIPAVG